MTARAAFAAVAAAVLALVAAPAYAAPQPCNGVPQIEDVNGDGHHPNTDVVQAWFSEQNGRLQAVVKPKSAVYEPMHDEPTAVAAWIVLYDVGGQTRYVRARAPRGSAVQFDQGTWSGGGGFVSAGPTTGEAVAGAGGTVTIDLPSVGAGTTLARPFVLTYDGPEDGDPHWVDRAPGGESPTEQSFGADYVVGSCVQGGGGTGGGTGGGGGGGQTGTTGTTTAVVLTAPAKLSGGGTVTLSGRVLPARAGVPVDLAIKGKQLLARRVRTKADGTYSVRLPVTETSSVRAMAEGIGSQTRRIVVNSMVSIRVRKAQSTTTVIATIRPKLAGRLLLLRTTSPTPSATKTVKSGTSSFTFRLNHLRPGRYQVVYIPSGGRAERSTSNTGVIR